MMHPSRQAYVEEASDTGPGPDLGIDLDSIPIDHNHALPTTASHLAPQSASALLSQFERKRLAATIAVPTDDGRVRARLRELGDPITLFGEGPGDRRDRLRDLLATLAQHQQQQQQAQTTAQSPQPSTGTPTDIEMADASDDAASDDDNGQDEEFYSHGGPDLLQARIDIARYSLPRAKQRIAFQKVESTIPLRTHLKHRRHIKDRLRGFELQASQTVGTRHVSMTRLSPSGSLVAAGNWGGSVHLIDVPSLDTRLTLRGHSAKISGLAWAPGATLPDAPVAPGAVNLASGGAEGRIHLWSLEQDTPLATLTGHAPQRVCRVEFHPSGRYLASASEDCTWRLWDVAREQELLLQEGHARGVYVVAFNIDGSLVASAGLDSIGRVWDLRSGRTIMILDGHIKPIYALDWGTDGHRLLSGSADGWIKCWDVRKVAATAEIGAHNNAVADVRWFKGMDGPLDRGGGMGEVSGTPKTSATFFASAGVDSKVNVYSADDWALVQTLGGHTGPVGSVDVSRDGRWIVSGGNDRTVKLWGRNDGLGVAD